MAGAWGDAVIRLEGRRVFVYGEAIDMRKAFEGLGYLVRERMKRNIIEGDLFVFVGRNRSRMKVLMFDGTGLVLVTKRLEKGRFSTIAELEGREELSAEEYRLIFAGTRVNFPLGRRAEDFLLGAPSQTIGS